jgi:hypothetical protein
MDQLKDSRGFSVLEIMIAIALALITITGVVLASGGTAGNLGEEQTAILGAETNADAVRLSQQLIETAEALNREDFNLVNAVATTTDGIYQKSVSVDLLPDYLTKLVTSFVTWTGDHGKQLSTKTSTLVTNLENVTSPNTCNSSILGNWASAGITDPIDVGAAAFSGNPVTEVSVFNKKLYVTTSNTHGHNDDFYTYDIAASSTNPTFLASLDANIVTPGLNGVAVASTTSGVYAYVANGNGATFTTCTQSASCSQLQVINVTNSAAPTVIKSYKLQSTSTPFVTGSGGQAAANTVTYKDGYVYIGLSKTASGPEFDIIDVGGGGGSASPSNPVYTGSYAIGRAVNSIMVKGAYAYLGTADNARELVILNISNPSNPTLVGIFDPPGSNGFGGGNTAAIVGTKLYVGRNYVSNAPEFYILNITTPSSPAILGSKDPGVAADPQSINGIVVRDYLTFVTMTGSFQIWNTANPAAITLVKSFDLSGNGANSIASDCENNYIYVGSYRINNDKGVIYVVYPGV